MLLLALLLAGPLGLRTQGPLRELFLDMIGSGARPLDAAVLEVRWSLANSWNEPMTLTRGQERGQQFLDEQADSLTIALRKPLSRRVWTSVEWKLTEHWGGYTDRTIEIWHSIIGAFDYQRPRYGRGQVHLRYLDDGGVAFDLSRPTLAPGDATVRTQVALADFLAARLDLKLPIGSLSRAGGSGGFDAGAGLVGTVRITAWGTLHGLLAVSHFSQLSAPTLLQPRPWHLTAEASLEARLSAGWTLLVEDRVLSPLLMPGWDRAPGGGDDAWISSGMNASFRAHNQISAGARSGRLSFWLSEDFTPGPNPHSVLPWIWVSNAPDIVVGAAWTQPL